jgi:predicted nucleotidyltransferase component of viral defense system
MTIHSETLPEKTKILVTTLQEKKPSFLDRFYLSGGTALSLQIGHRESEDLDFFIEQSFDPGKLQTKLERFGSLENLELDEGTLNTYLDQVKLQFLEYPYPLLRSSFNWNGIQLSSVEDIACTKLQTIGMRGSKKDFVDLFFLLEMFTLPELFSLISDKYENANFSKTHILKSLTYFIDAEAQPMPRMHKEVSWDEIKKDITKKVKTFSF